MNKLTAARCREKISEYEGFEKRGTLTESGRETHQALIIAISVLEKEEAEGEWIEWHGGECPVEDGSLVEVKFDDGDIECDALPEGWRWTHSTFGCNIVAYRIIQP